MTDENAFTDIQLFEKSAMDHRHVFAPSKKNTVWTKSHMLMNLRHRPLMITVGCIGHMDGIHFPCDCV